MEASYPATAAGNGGSGGSGGGNVQQHSQVSNGGKHGVVQGLIAYKHPRHDENCRICNMLETEGDSANIYDDHIGASVRRSSGRRSSGRLLAMT